jgi:hypothetical protein
MFWSFTKRFLHFVVSIYQFSFAPLRGEWKRLELQLEFPSGARMRYHASNHMTSQSSWLLQDKAGNLSFELLLSQTDENKNLWKKIEAGAPKKDTIWHYNTNG